MQGFASTYQPAGDNLSINKTLTPIEDIIAENSPGVPLGEQPNIQGRQLSAGCMFYAPSDCPYNYLKCQTDEGTLFYFYKTGLTNIAAIGTGGETLTGGNFALDEWFTIYKPQFDVLTELNPNVFIERGLKDRYVEENNTLVIDPMQQGGIFNNPATQFNDLLQISNDVLSKDNLYQENNVDLTSSLTYYHVGTPEVATKPWFKSATATCTITYLTGQKSESFQCFTNDDSQMTYGAQPTGTPNGDGSFKPSFGAIDAWIKGIDVYYDSTKITSIASTGTCTIDLGNKEQHETRTGVTCNYVSPGHYHIDANVAIVTSVGYTCYVKISNSETINVTIGGTTPDTIEIPETYFDGDAPTGKYTYLIVNANCISDRVANPKYATDMMNTYVIPVNLNDAQQVRAIFTPYIDNGSSTSAYYPELYITQNSIIGFIETPLPPLVVKNNNALYYAQNYINTESPQVTIPLWKNTNTELGKRYLYLSEISREFTDPSGTPETEPYFFINPAVNQYLLDYSKANSPIPLNSMIFDFQNPTVEGSFVMNWQDKLLLSLSDANLSPYYEQRSIPNYYQFVYSDYIPYQTSTYLTWVQNNPTTEATARENYRDQTIQMNKDISLMQRQNAGSIASGALDLLNGDYDTTKYEAYGEGAWSNALKATPGFDFKKAIIDTTKFVGNSIMQTAAMNNRISAMRTRNDIQMRSLNSQFTNIKASPNQSAGSITASYGYDSLGVVFVHKELKDEQKNLIMNEFAQYGYVLNYESSFSSIFNRMMFNPATINTSYNLQVLNQLIRDNGDNKVLNTNDIRTQFLSFLSVPHVYYYDYDFTIPYSENIEIDAISATISPEEYYNPANTINGNASMEIGPWATYTASGTYTLEEDVSSFPVKFNGEFGRVGYFDVDGRYHADPCSATVEPTYYYSSDNHVNGTAYEGQNSQVISSYSSYTDLTHDISSVHVSFHDGFESSVAVNGRYFAPVYSSVVIPSSFYDSSNYVEGHAYEYINGEQVSSYPSNTTLTENVTSVFVKFADGYSSYVPVDWRYFEPIPPTITASIDPSSHPAGDNTFTYGAYEYYDGNLHSSYSSVETLTENVYSKEVSFEDGFSSSIPVEGIYNPPAPPTITADVIPSSYYSPDNHVEGTANEYYDGGLHSSYSSYTDLTQDVSQVTVSFSDGFSSSISVDGKYYVPVYTADITPYSYYDPLNHVNWTSSGNDSGTATEYKNGVPYRVYSGNTVLEEDVSSIHVKFADGNEYDIPVDGKYYSTPTPTTYQLYDLPLNKTVTSIVFDNFNGLNNEGVGSGDRLEGGGHNMLSIIQLTSSNAELEYWDSSQQGYVLGSTEYGWMSSYTGSDGTTWTLSSKTLNIGSNFVVSMNTFVSSDYTGSCLVTTSN